MFQIGSHQFMQYYASILHFSVNRSIKTRKKVPRRQYDWKMKKLPSMLRFFKKGNLRSISRFMDQTDVCFNGESVSYWWYHQFLVRLAAFCFFFKTQFLPRTFGISKHLLRFQESVKSSKFKDHVPLKIFYVLRSTYVHKNKQQFLRS